jgi:putative endonuclease
LQRYTDIRAAIAREKQLKGWSREKKIRLIEALNPTWQDLSEEWGKPIGPLRRTADPSTPAPRDGASAQDDKK